jgi:hypothetical protein
MIPKSTIPKMVQVILEFRGQQHHLTVSEDISEKHFKKEAKKLTHTRIGALGMDAWSVKAGHVYAVMETREMKIRLHDIAGRVRKMAVHGDESLHEVCEQLRAAWNLDPWTKVTVERVDKKPL